MIGRDWKRLLRADSARSFQHSLKSKLEKVHRLVTQEQKGSSGLVLLNQPILPILYGHA